MIRTERRRRGNPFAALLMLGILVAVVSTATLVTSAYHLGFSTGLIGSGTLVLVYQVPAVIFDWPRITLEHILGFFAFLGDLLSSLWD